MIDVVVASYMSIRLPIGRSFVALRHLNISTLSRMCEQERTGVMLKLVHFRDAMQLDASHVTSEVVQNNCRMVGNSKDRYLQDTLYN